MHPPPAAEARRATSKAPPLSEKRFGPVQKPQKERAEENGKKQDMGALRVKYNIALVAGTVGSFIGAWGGAHVTESITTNPFIAAVPGAIAGSYLCTAAFFSATWRMFRWEMPARDFAKETAKLVGKNMAAGLGFVVFLRSPVSALIALAHMPSEIAAIAGVVASQIGFYTLANLFTWKDFNRKNQQSKGNANIVLEKMPSDINRESQNGDIRE